MNKCRLEDFKVKIAHISTVSFQLLSVIHHLFKTKQLYINFSLFHFSIIDELFKFKYDLNLIFISDWHQLHEKHPFLVIVGSKVTISFSQVQIK